MRELLLMRQTCWKVALAMAFLFAAGLMATPAAAEVPDIEPADAPCARTPNPARWLDSGTPDTGRETLLYSVHRDGPYLAPQQTVWAVRNTLAYEPPMIEMDVRQTADHHFVNLHDADVSGRSDGAGTVETLSLEALQTMNFADYAPWKGGIYDPARVMTLEEILDIARESGVGVEFDMKFMLDSQPNSDLAAFAALVNPYPDVLRRSIISVPPPAAQLAHALIPEGRFMYNLLDQEPAAALYPLTELASVFGGSTDLYTAEKIAAIHDGCGIVVPHSYDEGVEKEVEQMQWLRTIGADGFQTNQPDLARALFAGPVATQLVSGVAADVVCLVNRQNGHGLTLKRLELRKGGTPFGEVTTAKAGCAQLPASAASLRIEFAGDGSASPALLLAVVALPRLALTSDLLSALTGQTVTLQWLSEGATDCAASGAWAGAKSLVGSESLPVGNLAGQLTYTLSCWGDGGMVHQSLLLDVRDPPPALPEPAERMGGGGVSARLLLSFALTLAIQRRRRRRAQKIATISRTQSTL